MDWIQSIESFWHIDDPIYIECTYCRGEWNLLEQITIIGQVYGGVWMFRYNLMSSSGRGGMYYHRNKQPGIRKTVRRLFSKWVQWFWPDNSKNGVIARTQCNSQATPPLRV